MLPEYRIVTLENILAIRVIYLTLLITRIIREADSPSIRSGQRVTGFRLRILDPRSPGVTGCRVNRRRKRSGLNERRFRLDDRSCRSRRWFRYHIDLCDKGTFSIVAIAAFQR